MIDASALAISSGSSPIERFTATVDASGRIVLSGDLVDDGLDALRSILELALLDPGDLIMIDVSQLVSIEPVAIAELLRYQLVAFAQQRRFCLEAVPRCVAKTLDHLDVSHILMGCRKPDLSPSEWNQVVGGRIVSLHV